MFEERQNEFPPPILEYYQNSKTYHDGKWMFIDVHHGELVKPLIQMIALKKKPNRKKEELSRIVMGKCGNRCDACLLHESNNTTAKGNLIFQQGDCRCYHSANPEDETDYSAEICKGCHDDCEAAKCTDSRGHQSCIECNYHECIITTNNFINSGRCNLGLTYEELEQFVLPYCGKERFDKIKSTGEKYP